MKSLLVSVLALTVPLAACSVVGEESDDSGQDGGDGGTVVLVTHESFQLPRTFVRKFEAESG